MAKQVKGARANKPNDSFGVVNNSNLYKNKYREDVDKEDEDDIEETIEAQDPTEEVATQGANDSFADAKESHDYKKRYDDLKKHYDAKLNEFRDERDKLASEVKSAKAMQHVSQGMPAPRTVEELQQFKEQYPDIYEVVETVAGVQTENKVAQLREEIASVKEREESLKKEKAYEELSHTHPDFGELKSDDKFLQWLDEQPEQISNGIYKNNTDARWAGKVVSLYKAEMGISTKKSTKSSQNDAAASVTKNQPKDVATSDQKGKIWKMSDIAKLKAWEFEKLEKEIDLARSEGRITQ
jgi:hypothetical protein